MIEYSVLDIPSVIDIPFRLKDIIYNCPICDYDIEIDIIIDDNSFLKCENCDLEIKLKAKKI
jgi:hypothetical protein